MSKFLTAVALCAGVLSLSVIAADEPNPFKPKTPQAANGQMGTNGYQPGMGQQGYFPGAAGMSRGRFGPAGQAIPGMNGIPAAPGAADVQTDKTKPKLPARKLGSMELIGKVDGTYIYRSDYDYWFDKKGNPDVETADSPSVPGLPATGGTVRVPAAPTSVAGNQPAPVNAQAGANNQAPSAGK